MLAKQIMSVLWPSFLTAGVLEMLVFGLVDPLEAGSLGKYPEMSRQTVYALGFGVFWLITTVSSALSVWLVSGTAEGDD